MTAVAKKERVRRPAEAASEGLNLGVLSDVMGFRLRRIQNHLAKSFIDQVSQRYLKSGMFSILALIDANPGVSQARLAQEAGIDKTSLVALLDQMEELAWVVRTRSVQDRRRHSLSTTDKGRRALAEITEDAHKTEAPARDSLSPQELDQLFATLDKLYGACFREEVL